MGHTLHTFQSLHTLHALHTVWGCPWIIHKFNGAYITYITCITYGALFLDVTAPGRFWVHFFPFSKVSLTLRILSTFVEVPQVCLRNGALIFA